MWCRKFHYPLRSCVLLALFSLLIFPRRPASASAWSEDVKQEMLKSLIEEWIESGDHGGTTTSRLPGRLCLRISLS